MWGQLIRRKFVASYNPCFDFLLVIKVWFGGALKSATVQSKRTNSVALASLSSGTDS